MVNNCSIGKLCCGLEREEHAVVVGRGLQLEIEAAAKAFSHRQAPGAVDPRPERRMNHELHAARFIEEPLEHDFVARGHNAERGQLGGDILQRLRGGPVVYAALLDEPSEENRSLAPVLRGEGLRWIPLRPSPPAPLPGVPGRGEKLLAGWKPALQLGPDPFAAARFPRTARSSCPALRPARKGSRRGALGVGDDHFESADLANHPRRSAQQEHVAGQRLDGEILIHRADKGSLARSPRDTRPSPESRRRW